MDYKTFYYESPQFTIFNSKSANPKFFEYSNINDDFEIDPEIFIYIEKGLSQKNSAEIIKILDDFEIASKVLSRQYIQTFGQTNVPLKLVEFLTSSNLTISYYASRIICSLITSNTPEYADALCQNNFLLQCSMIFKKKLNDPSLIYVILVSLSNLATFSKAVCDLILSYINVDILAYYAQSKILDDGSYNELLRLLVILSYNNTNEEITSQLIELTQSIFSDLINDDDDLKRYRILQLAFLFSKCPQFYDFFQYDHSTIKLLEILLSSKKTREELYFLIPILTNILNFVNDDFYEELLEICGLVSMINENDLILDEDLRIIKLSCRFIQAYIKKNTFMNEDLADKIINMLVKIIGKYGFKERSEILFCIYELLIYISEDVLFNLIFSNSLFETIVDSLESEDEKLIICTLEMLISFFQLYEKSSHFSNILNEFINEDGINSLAGLKSTPNDDAPQISEMAMMLLNRYFLYY